MVAVGRLGDCYLAGALILVAKYDPRALEKAIQRISAPGEHPRRYLVTLKHFDHASRWTPCTVEVNDLFYTQSLASNLGFTGDDMPKRGVTLAHFDHESCNSWGKRRIDRMVHLANLRGVAPAVRVPTSTS